MTDITYIKTHEGRLYPATLIRIAQMNSISAISTARIGRVDRC